MDAAYRIFSYIIIIKGSPGKGILIRLSSSSSLELSGYSDADWAGCKDDRKTFGHLLEK